MWFLGLLAFLLVMAVPVLLVLSIISARRLNTLERTVLVLREEVDRIRRRDRAAPPAPAPIETPPPAPEPEPSVPIPTPPPIPRARRARSLDLESILGGQWLTWVGILALFFGTAFFLAVDLGRNALSGLPQILIGIAVAVAFNLVGRRLVNRQERVLGLGLLGGGIALLYLAAYAAHGFHQLVPLWVVFPLLLGAATVGSALALERNSLIIASLTLTGAYLTPLVLAGGANPTFGLLPYLVAVNLGAVLVGGRRGWAGLPLAAFVANLVLVAMWWARYFDPSLRGFAFLCVTGTWLVFAVAPWLRRGGGTVWSALRGLVLAANGLIYALLCYNLLGGGGEHLRGPMLLLLAVLHVGLARIMERRRGADPATRLTFITGVALAAIFVPVQFDLAWITLGWILLATVLLWSGVRERDPWQRAVGLAVLAMSSLRALIVDLPQVAHHDGGHSPWLNGEFLAGLVLVGVLAWLVRVYHRCEDILTRHELSLRTPLLIAAVIIGVWKLSAELAGFFAWWEPRLGRDLDHVTVLAVTLLWAIAGAGTAVGGIRSRVPALRVTGDVLVGAALAVTAGVTVITGRALVPDYRPLVNPAFVQGAVLTGILGGLYRWYRRMGPPTSYHATPLLLGTLGFGIWKLSAEIVSFFGWWERLAAQDFGRTAPLVLMLVWAVIGAVLIQRGVVKRLQPLRIMGDLLVAIAIAVTTLLTLYHGTGLAVQHRPLLNLPFLQGVALVALLVCLFRWFHVGGQRRGLAAAYHGAPLIITAALLLLMRLSFEVGLFFDPGTDVRELKSLLTISVVWAVYASGLVVAGFVRRYRPIRLLGMVLLLATVVKVFLLDMQALDKGYRIVAFVVLGVLLLGISMLYQRERRGHPDGESD